MQAWLRSCAILLALGACGDDGSSSGGSGAETTNGPGAGGAGGAGAAPSGGAGGSDCECPANASCDEAGACVCDAGFTGDGVMCVDVNECFAQADDCAPTATCVNQPGSYTCECPMGFAGDPLTACEPRFLDVTAGTVHTCAVRSDLASVCFGNGGSGRLGNGLTAHQPEPTQAGAAFNWSTLRAGAGHTCGLKDSGTLWCWGSGGFGQLGLGTTTNQVLPAYVSLDDVYVDVATADSHTCAITDAGELVCFGRNNQGQLGIASLVDQSSPTFVSLTPGADPPDSDWVNVFAGRESTCAIKDSGRLYCWGRNSDRQIAADSPAIIDEPRLVETSAGADDADWEDGAIASTACAWKTSGALYCWGNNADGELGAGAPTDSATPALVADVTSAASVTVGAAHVCAIDDEDALRCWGRNTSAQIAPGLATPVAAPTLVAGSYRKVTAGTGHTCALTTDDGLRCWGARTFGQTGNGFGHRTSPEALPGGELFEALAGSATSLLAIRGDDHILSAGQNDKGQLGLGARTPTKLLEPIEGATNFTRVAAGLSHACAITAGKIHCAGDNTFGQLGRTGGAQTSFVPITTTGKPWAAETFVALTAGDHHTCALTQSAKLYCFGLNTSSQLGGTTPALGDLVQLVAPASTWTHVAAGSLHTCARTADAKLRCWGRNTEGQIGNGTTTTPVTTPTEIGTGFSGNVAAGVNHTCALETAGALYCWGRNTSSQLGDNTTVEQLSPALIAPGTTYAKIFAGNAFTCAIDADAQASCWGANGTGQLGVGDVAARKVPTPVLDGLFESLVLGTAHACGLRADGTAACWGSGEFGQNALGIGWDELPTEPTGGP